MINLIPTKEKKEIVRGFYYRLVILFFVVVGVAFLITSIAMLPSYFLSYTVNNIQKGKIEIQKKEPAPLPQEQTEKIIHDLDNKLNIIEQRGENTFDISNKVINAILLKKMPSIKITNISYEDNSQGLSFQSKKISIQGIAPSREILLLFRKALEDDTNFKSVDLPISNFIKGSNIEFYLSLIPS